MFRTLLFSIVLTLASGQSALLACGVLCDGTVPSSGECHHDHTDGTSAQVASKSHCHMAGPDAAAFLREDGRRAVTAPAGDCAIAAPLLHLATVAPSREVMDDVGPILTPFRRPPTPLRI